MTLPDGFEIAENKVEGFWDVEGVYEYVGTIPHRGQIALLMASRMDVPTVSKAIKDECEKDRRSLVTSPLDERSLREVLE